MIKLLLRLIATAVTILVIAHAVPGVTITSIPVAFLVAIIWGVISVTLRPLLKLLTLPISLLTLGLFSFILNALLFWLVAGLSPGFTVSGFLPALEGSFILTLVSAVLHAVL